jgi:hypothetical protein
LAAEYWYPQASENVAKKQRGVNENKVHTYRQRGKVEQSNKQDKKGEIDTLWERHVEENKETKKKIRKNKSKNEKN